MQDSLTTCTAGQATRNSVGGNADVETLYGVGNLDSVFGGFFPFLAQIGETKTRWTTGIERAPGSAGGRNLPSSGLERHRVPVEANPRSHQERRRALVCTLS